MVVVIGRRLLAQSGFGGQGQAAFELVIIVRVEEVVLAIVLVVDHRIDLAQSLAKPVRQRGAGASGPVGILPPFDEPRRQLVLVRPCSAVDQMPNTGAVSPWCRTENPRPCLKGGVLF
jgi:hypothetical protein